MKKKIIGFVYAILITVIIVFEYINAVWPHTIPCINGRVAFVLIPLLATLWILLYNDKVKLRYVALIVVVNFVLVICPTIAIESFIMKKDKTIRIGYVYAKYRSGNTKGGRTIPDRIGVVITDSLKTSLSVDNKTFMKINVGDTIIVKVSSRGHIDYKNLFPTHEEIERYKVPQHYINGKLQENSECKPNSVR